MRLLHIILGIATLLIIASLVYLGIKTFHPEPVSPYTAGIVKPAPYPREFNCAQTDKQCIADRDAYYNQQDQINAENAAKEQEYEAALRVWNKDYFIASNIVGIIVFAIAFWLLTNAGAATQSVAIGSMAAGLWSIIFAYGRGWNSVDDKIKFVVGLVVAVLVIGSSIWLMKRYYEKKKVGAV